MRESTRATDPFGKAQGGSYPLVVNRWNGGESSLAFLSFWPAISRSRLTIGRYDTAVAIVQKNEVDPRVALPPSWRRGASCFPEDLQHHIHQPSKNKMKDLPTDLGLLV